MNPEKDRSRGPGCRQPTLPKGEANMEGLGQKGHSPLLMDIGLEQPQTYPSQGLPFAWHGPSVASQSVNSKERS